MNVLERFLQSEINTQELYDDIMAFIKSYHVRNGEFEGNEYIIKKMDQTNFIIFPEYDDGEGGKEIHAAEAVYRDNLIKTINEYAVTKGLSVESEKS